MTKKMVGRKIVAQPEAISGSVQKMNVSKKLETYQPEYSRLGLEPKPPARVSPEEFSFGKKKKKTSALQSEPAPKVSGYTVPKKLDLPETQSRGHIWYPLEEDSIEQTEQYAHAEIAYDEIEELELEEPEDNFLEKAESDFLEAFQEARAEILPEELHQLSPGQYCLSVQGTVICVASSLEETEEQIETLIFDPDSEYHGISIEEIAVFQRLELKFGISIKR